MSVSKKSVSRKPSSPTKTVKLPAQHRHHCPVCKDEWVHPNQRCDRVRTRICTTCMAKRPRTPKPGSTNIGERLGLKSDLPPTAQDSVVDAGDGEPTAAGCDGTAAAQATEAWATSMIQASALVQSAAELGQRHGRRAAKQAKARQAAEEAKRIAPPAEEPPATSPNPEPSPSQPTATMRVLIQKSRKTPGRFDGYLQITTPTARYHRALCHDIATAAEAQAISDRHYAQYVAAGEVPARRTPPRTPVPTPGQSRATPRWRRLAIVEPPPFDPKAAGVPF